VTNIYHVLFYMGLVNMIQKIETIDNFYVKKATF